MTGKKAKILLLKMSEQMSGEDRDALLFAVDHLSDTTEDKEHKEKSINKERLSDLSRADLADLGLDVRTIKALHYNGINTVGELVSYDCDTLLKCRNIGAARLKDILIQLKAAGISLKG